MDSAIILNLHAALKAVSQSATERYIKGFAEGYGKGGDGKNTSSTGSL